MKAWQLHSFGIEHLKPGMAAVPEPKDNEILVRVGAVSLNFRDKAIMDGIYLPHLVPPSLIPVSDAAGTVVGIGKDVKKFRVGDRVVSHLYSHWRDGLPGPDESDFALGSPLAGGLAEYMILEADSAVLTPASLSDEEAATLPIAALTGWFSLVTYGNLKAGETVVIQGTGGVSIFGLQMAHALGARVILTTSSDEKGERVRALGADEVINYVKTPDWAGEVVRLTGGVGADHVLDVAGGNGINDSVRAARVGGRVSVIGFLAGQTAAVDLMPVIFRQTKIQGICVGHLKAFEEMNVAFDMYGIKPVIGKVYEFDEVIEAHRHMEKGAFGKIVIRVS